MMQDYYQRLQYELEVSQATITATTEAACNARAIAPTRLFSSNIQLNKQQSHRCNLSQQNCPTTSDLISWAENFSNTSSFIDCKPSVQEKEFLKKENPVQKKTNKAKKARKNKNSQSIVATRKKTVSNDGVPSMVARTKSKPARGKKRHVEGYLDLPSLQHKKPRMASPANSSLDIKFCKQPQSLERKVSKLTSLVQKESKIANSFVHQATSSSLPTRTIASDVAITLTPHPFKKSKTIKGDLLPPPEVAVEDNEPLSEITCRSSSRRSNIAFGRITLGVSVAIPRALFLVNGTRTVSSPKVASSLKINSSKMDDKKRSNAMFRETSIDKPSLTTIDEACPALSLQSAAKATAHHSGALSHGNFGALGVANCSYLKNDTYADKENCKEEVGPSDTMPPHIMSVSL